MRQTRSPAGSGAGPSAATLTGTAPLPDLQFGGWGGGVRVWGLGFGGQCLGFRTCR